MQQHKASQESPEFIRERFKTFFISDTHFCHTNIIKYCNRPFATVNEMNEEMIKRWNSVVGPEDLVIHGGDFSLSSKDVAIEIFRNLNGNKILVRGNHDGSGKRMLETGFLEVKHYWVNGEIFVYHYRSLKPNDCIYKDISDRCKYFLHGHAHNNPDNIKDPKFINICVENLDYTPKTIEQLIEIKNKEGLK